MQPIVKWAGGKRQLLSVLKSNLPSNYNTYFEPFIGGGALFFNLMPTVAVISDINSNLINFYTVVKTKLTQLLDNLKYHNLTSEEYFYTVRDMDISGLNDVQLASRFLFLNKTCFNGLYRENSKGKFNVPYGKYKNPLLYDLNNITEISNYLNNNNIQIYNFTFSEIINHVQSGDFIYLDPPYFPLTDTSFTKYNKQDFNKESHLELFKLFEMLTHKNCFVMSSNSNSPFITNLYKNYNIIEVNAKRSINSDSTGRGSSICEIIIKNY